MNILKRIFGKKETQVQAPKLFKLELEFIGANGRVIKETHNHVKSWEVWQERADGFYHHISFSDGKRILIAEMEGFRLARVISSNE